MIFEILGTAALLNLIFWKCKENHSLEFEHTFNKIGRLEGGIGIEEPDYRDFDLTIQYSPLWYVTFQLSLWTVYVNFAWSRNPDTHGFCDHECEKDNEESNE